MRIELEPHDIEEIAQRLSELLSPTLSKSSKGNNDDIIFDVMGLAEYLHVDTSWIYKAVQLKTIPYIKCGKYLRFQKSAIDKYLEKNTVQAVSPMKLPR